MVTYEEAKAEAKEVLGKDWRSVKIALESEKLYVFDSEDNIHLGGRLPVYIDKKYGDAIPSWSASDIEEAGYNEYTVIEDDNLGYLYDKETVDKYKKQIRMIKGSIIDTDADAVVNAANSELLPGSGVCGAIFEAAGYTELLMVCKKIGHCDTGSAVITPGFKMNAKHIIHAVGPKWHGGKNSEENDLRCCYEASLILAEQNDCKSIAFPVISAGIYGYPVKKALDVAIDEILIYLIENESELEVSFRIINDKILGRFGKETYNL